MRSVRSMSLNIMTARCKRIDSRDQNLTNITITVYCDNDYHIRIFCWKVTRHIRPKMEVRGLMYICVDPYARINESIRILNVFILSQVYPRIRMHIINNSVLHKVSIYQKSYKSIQVGMLVLVRIALVQTHLPFHVWPAGFPPKQCPGWLWIYMVI